jgi:hypothetical protein
MTPVETQHLVTFLASVYPSVRVREPATPSWRALLADVDTTDAWVAAIRLAQHQHEIAARDIAAEAHRIREERLTGHPRPDDDPDDQYHYRAALPAAVTAMVSLRVPCPWCGAAVGQPCTLPGGDIPMRRTPAHPARLVAVELAGREKGRRERLEWPVSSGGTHHVR